jgi:hypothetical protein
MEIKQEKIIIENTIKLLRKGRYEITGDEVAVFYQCLTYLIDKVKSLDTPKQTIVAESKPIQPEPVIKKPKKVKNDE